MFRAGCAGELGMGCWREHDPEVFILCSLKMWLPLVDLGEMRMGSFVSEMSVHIQVGILRRQLLKKFIYHVD